MLQSDFQTQLSIRTLEQSDQNAIVELRKKVFAIKYGSSVDLKGLEWNRTDQFGTHIGAYQDSELISVIRLSYIDSNEHFERLLQFPATDPFASAPSFCLARAATAQNAGGQSLNLALRLEAYRQVLLNPRNASYIFGTTLFNAHRIQLLKDIGYEVFTHTTPWQGYLNSGQQPIAIFRLPIEGLETAMNKLMQTIPKTIFPSE